MILLVLAVRMVAILKITGQRLVLELFPGLSDAQNDEWLSTFLSAHRLVGINLLTLIFWEKVLLQGRQLKNCIKYKLK